MNITNLRLDNDIIKGVYLLILLILGGEAATTYSKPALGLIQTNYIAKHVLLLCIIYFAIDYSHDKIKHPLETIITSVIIWIVYIIMSKQNLVFTIITFALVTIIYILYDFEAYYKDQPSDFSTNDKIQSDIQRTDGLIRILLYVLIGISIFGFGQYYLYQRKQYKRKFKTARFIFGSKLPNV